jgi:hypothetical protein
MKKSMSCLWSCETVVYTISISSQQAHESTRLSITSVKAEINTVCIDSHPNMHGRFISTKPQSEPSTLHPSNDSRMHKLQSTQLTQLSFIHSPLSSLAAPPLAGRHPQAMQPTGEAPDPLPPAWLIPCQTSHPRAAPPISDYS